MQSGAASSLANIGVAPPASAAPLGFAAGSPKGWFRRTTTFSLLTGWTAFSVAVEASVAAASVATPAASGAAAGDAAAAAASYEEAAGAALGAGKAKAAMKLSALAEELAPDDEEEAAG